MYIQKINIKNYRNFGDFSMEFHRGLNVIIGANNCGKTGLLYAIRLIKEPSITIHDFNKNNLLQYDKKYIDESPKIEIEYIIRHEISEDNTEDESIIFLLSFLGMNETKQMKKEENGSIIYDIVARVKMTYALESRALGDYKKDVSTIKDFDEYMQLLERYIDRYSWTYTNGSSNAVVDRKEATRIFDIRFIGAERTSAEVYKETKLEIDKFVKDEKNASTLQQLHQNITNELKDLLSETLQKMSGLFENENNEVGLAKGNVSIAQNIRPNISIADAYTTDVKDTKSGYVLPLEYNGLGYNNLINIYMLIKLTEFRRDKDFRVLCLEEPEAHLHPAMQYKLFKFLRTLDEKDELNQQIFVTTHSSNISAVAGIDNMFMLAYERVELCSECKQQSLSIQFVNNEDESINEKKQEAKRHLTKFLDVTRSDMLFADKVILVEGIAEKLLLPKFMELCGCPYEDEHISIVEIGGKHFEHFIELFNENNVIKRVLCITDNDFEWIKSGIPQTYNEYQSYKAEHINNLNKRFPINNLKIYTQTNGGRTFEDELFLANYVNTDVAISLIKVAISNSMKTFVDNNGIDFSKWLSNSGEMDGRSKEKVERILSYFKSAIANDIVHESDYERLFFAELFLEYAKNQKGDVALDILVNDELTKKMIVPQYIKEGLEWLLK